MSKCLLYLRSILIIQLQTPSLVSTFFGLGYFLIFLFYFLLMYFNLVWEELSGENYYFVLEVSFCNNLDGCYYFVLYLINKIIVFVIII